MFHTRYVPLVEKEKPTHEYLDLRKGTETVTKITNMFTEKARLCPELVASEKDLMTQYLSVIKTEIW